MASLTVWKGHGTENDFVIVEDLDGGLELSDALVRALCDRRAGVGADGVLRVVRTRAFDPDPAPHGPEFFMDYRNADGSVAEMCGNGARVFVRFLIERGWVDAAQLGAGLSIGTRAGAVAVHGPAGGEPADWITVALGPARWLDAAPTVDAPGLTTARTGLAVAMPNPHVVVFVEPGELDALELARPPSVDPPLPEGQNVEFVARLADGLRMRVHERGVGETRSCGTGIAAAAVVAESSLASTGALTSTTATSTTAPSTTTDASAGRTAASAGRTAGGDGRPWPVDVPGGRCVARWQPDGHVALAGPAVLVGQVVLDAHWLDAVTPDPVRSTR